MIIQNPTPKGLIPRTAQRNRKMIKICLLSIKEVTLK